VVEDPIIQKFLRSVLERRGYPVLEAVPPQALGLIQAPDAGVSLVVTNRPDWFLPVAEQIRLVYIAAFPDPALASLFRTCRVLQKPFHPAALLEAIRELAVS